MTIAAIGLDIAIFILLLIVVIYGISECWDGIVMFFIITIALVILGGIIGFQLYFYKHTESGKRAVKTQQSNFKGGIKREIKVYDIEGDLIQKYEGKFDIEYDDNRILFDDEKGNRHIIYYPTGTIIIDEIKGEKNE